MFCYRILLFFLYLLFAISCSLNKKETEKIILKKNNLTSKPSKLQVKQYSLPWDTLTHKNTQSFLKAYGKKNTATKVLITTKFGNIKLRLYKDTPIHRASFIFLTEVGYFNNTVFYRVVKNFVVQGGDSDSFTKSKMRNKYKNYKLLPEFRKNRTHKYGALAAAREWENNPKKQSTPFEFYIVQNRYGAHHLNNEHTVFGEVIAGFNTIDKIANVKIGEGEWPVTDIFMKITVID